MTCSKNNREREREICYWDKGQYLTGRNMSIFSLFLYSPDGKITNHYSNNFPCVNSLYTGWPKNAADKYGKYSLINSYGNFQAIFFFEKTLCR